MLLLTHKHIWQQMLQPCRKDTTALWYNFDHQGQESKQSNRKREVSLILQPPEDIFTNTKV